jgi:glycosyltransferase involved in cell wall biosynthesis
MTALLFTPLLPSPTGGGSTMRVSAVLEVLAEQGPVIVVHLPVWGDRSELFDRSWVHRHAAAVLRITDTELPELLQRVQAALTACAPGQPLRLIHAFRLVLAPPALRCLGLAGASRPRLLLDLDDDECARDLEYAALEQAAGRSERAERLRAERERMERFRGLLLQRFDQVFLANASDCRLLAQRHPDRCFVHLPNVIRSVPQRSLEAVDPHSLLFLGTLDYLPNEDGVAFFVREVLPLIRAADAAMTLRVVGVGLPPSLVDLAALPGVTLVGPVPETAPEFARAGMLVVPLRAGSGSRIKILEAFQHGTPVVSTAKGAEGLAVVDGEQLLLAESPAELAAACLALAADPALRQRLATNARGWVEREHGLAAMATVLARAREPVEGKPG